MRAFEGAVGAKIISLAGVFMKFLGTAGVSTIGTSCVSEIGDTMTEGLELDEGAPHTSTTPVRGRDSMSCSPSQRDELS